MAVFYRKYQEVAQMAANFRAGNYGYGHAKKELLAAYKRLFDPFREKRAELEKDPNAPEDMFIVPDTQEAIVSHAQWDRVQELRKNKRRPAKAERQGLFSGLLYCADCGGKLHFATCKSFEGKQDHYVCSKYKSGRGDCSAHYIREDVLRELVLERIQAVNEYIRGIGQRWHP